MWKCEIWANFFKNRYFAKNCLIKVLIWQFFCTHVTHIIVAIFCQQMLFLTIQILIRPSYTFSFSILRFSSVTKRSVSLENKNSKHLSPFLHKTTDSNNSFTLNWKQFQVFLIQCNSTLWPMGKMHPVNKLYIYWSC